MHAKYALALILALQVSVSLCEVPEPSQELVDKYTDMKNTLIRRIANAVGRLQEAIRPHMQGENGQAIMERFNAMTEDPRYKTLQNVLNAMAAEFTPLVDQARTKALGEYEHRLRPRIGAALDNLITTIKAYLDLFLPSE